MVHFILFSKANNQTFLQVKKGSNIHNVLKRAEGNLIKLLNVIDQNTVYDNESILQEGKQFRTKIDHREKEHFSMLWLKIRNIRMYKAKMKDIEKINNLRKSQILEKKYQGEDCYVS